MIFKGQLNILAPLIWVSILRVKIYLLSKVGWYLVVFCFVFSGCDVPNHITSHHTFGILGKPSMNMNAPR
jgi:hypothetical protein